MNRATFIKELRHNLKFLKKEELEKEVLYYINKIDESKISDEEVIQSFGKMENIVKEVCERHGLDYKMVKRQINSNWFLDFYHDLVDLSTVLKNSDGKKKVSILFDLLLLIVVTFVLKIPFIFIRDIGDNIANIFFNNITFLAIWGLVLEIAYVVVALSFFVCTFRKWFKGLNK